MKKALAGCLALLLSAATGSVQAVSDGTVRILVVTNLAGTYSDLAGPGNVTAARLALEEFNGRVAGAPVEIIVRDSELNPQTAANHLAEVHAERPVDMVIGPISSAVAVEVQEYADANGIITLHSGPSSTIFTNEACSPLAVQWGFDTYALAQASAAAAAAQGGDNWFFITADYEFGRDLEAQAARAVQDQGGRVAGSALIPHPATVIDEQIDEAMTSDADVIGLAMAGDDTRLAIQLLYEMGIASDPDRAAIAMEVFLTDILSLGNYVTSGLRYVTSFYWNSNDGTRAWSDRFLEREGVRPTAPQAGVYSAVRHYLRAVNAAGTDESNAVMTRMRDLRVDDGVFASDGWIREDGRMMHPLYLVEVQRPSEVRASQDYLRIVDRVPAEEAFPTVAEGRCQRL